MTKHVLFIHGAGEGAYEADELLARSLQKELGSGYEVHYLMMPDENNAPYADWKEVIEKEMASLETPVALVGHSVGGSHLAKILTQIKTRTPIVGAFILDAPFWGGEGWRYEGYEELELPKDTSSKFPENVPVFLYHTRDDGMIPFNHLSLYAKLIPQATVREIDSGGHQLNNDLSLTADDIKTSYSALK